MSAENFIKIFKDKRGSIDEAQDYNIYKTWVGTNKTWFNKNRKELEEQGLSKIVGLAVTEETATSLGVAPAFKELYKKVQNSSGGIGADIIDGKPTIVFQDIAFSGGIERTLDKYLGAGTYKEAKSQKLIKGHVYGFMTGAIQGATENLHELLTYAGTKARPEVPMMSEDEADSALDFLHILVKHLQQLDIASSDLKTITHPLLIKYNKSSEHFLIEMQPDVGNSESAKLVQKLAGQKGGNTGIRGLVNPGASQKLILDDILNILKEDGSLTAQEILGFKSSPSMIDLITDKLVASISKATPKLKEKYSSSIKVPTKLVSLYVNEKAKKEYRDKLSATIRDAKNNIAKIRANKAKVAALRTTQGQFYSLSSLQLLLDTHLQDVISANMGSGSESKILNYRTGRFASSAKVERLSQSREGYISAFYTFMKNPYQTFSEGFAQGSPKTRDPKILISTSIKEIAATKVGARMRAVLI